VSDIVSAEAAAALKPLAVIPEPMADQEGQSEHVLLSQRTVGFLQRLADSGVQAGIGDGHFLGHEGRCETGPDQQSQKKRTGDGKEGFDIMHLEAT